MKKIFGSTSLGLTPWEEHELSVKKWLGQGKRKKELHDL